MSQREDLRALLNLLPRLHPLDGRTVEEVCQLLQLARPRLLELVQSASALSWGEHDAGELLDIWVEDGRLHVHTGGSFEQVVRLVPQELLALRLGAAQLEAAGLAADAAELESLLLRIDESLGSPRELSGRLQSAVRAESDAALDPQTLELVRKAHGSQHRLELLYFSQHGQSLRLRLVEPWAPFQEQGVWYLQAWDVEREGERVFRLDRVVAARVLEESCAHQGPRPSPGTRPLSGTRRMRAGLKGSLARLALEQHWPDARLQPDGSVLVDTPADHADALLRSFLPWAPDLTVVEPPEMVTAWLALKQEMLERHGAVLGPVQA